jgi:hypothetical protein
MRVQWRPVEAAEHEIVSTNRSALGDALITPCIEHFDGVAAKIDDASTVPRRAAQASTLSSLPAGMKPVDDVRPAVSADDRGARLALQRFEGAANLHQCLHSCTQETWRREPLFRVAVLRTSA